MSDTYRTFKRSCNSFEEMVRARKIHYIGNLTYAEALEMCDRFNDNRTAAQIRKGTKMEFEREK